MKQELQTRMLWVVVILLAVLTAMQSWTIYRLQKAAVSFPTPIALDRPVSHPAPRPSRPAQPPTQDFWAPFDTEWDPFRELERLQRHIDSVFRDMFNRWRTLPGLRGRWESALPSFNPRVDLREEKDRYVVTVDLPGVDKSDIRVELNDRLLTISGRRFGEKRSSGRHFLRMEREYGEFSRQILLPGPVNSEGMKASYTNGVLTITIPKASRPSPRRNVPVL